MLSWLSRLLHRRMLMLNSGQCVGCGKDGATEVWRDADGEGWWVHAGC